MCLTFYIYKMDILALGLLWEHRKMKWGSAYKMLRLVHKSVAVIFSGLFTISRYLIRHNEFLWKVNHICSSALRKHCFLPVYQYQPLIFRILNSFFVNSKENKYFFKRLDFSHAIQVVIDVIISDSLEVIVLRMTKNIPGLWRRGSSSMYVSLIN